MVIMALLLFTYIVTTNHTDQVAFATQSKINTAVMQTEIDGLTDRVADLQGQIISLKVANFEKKE